MHVCVRGGVRGHDCTASVTCARMMVLVCMHVCIMYLCARSCVDIYRRVCLRACLEHLNSPDTIAIKRALAAWGEDSTPGVEIIY